VGGSAHWRWEITLPYCYSALLAPPPCSYVGVVIRSTTFRAAIRQVLTDLPSGCRIAAPRSGDSERSDHRVTTKKAGLPALPPPRAFPFPPGACRRRAGRQLRLSNPRRRRARAPPPRRGSRAPARPTTVDRSESSGTLCHGLSKFLSIFSWRKIK